MGTIEELPVVLGQRVRRGDLIARPAAGEISARLAQTQAQVAYTQRELDRERDLLAKGAGTAESARSLEDRLRLAVAARQEAEAMASCTDLRAPFDGAVSRRLVRGRRSRLPGQPLLEIEGDAGLEIEAMLPESATTGLTLGQRLPVLREDLRFRLKSPKSPPRPTLPPHGRTRLDRAGRHRRSSGPIRARAASLCQQPCRRRAGDCRYPARPDANAFSSSVPMAAPSSGSSAAAASRVIT
jgi:multidrug efflux pump subunit AcrA (membrane-fusion protein)